MNLFAVLVIYNCNIEKSDTLNSLIRNYQRNPEIFRNFELIIYDNSQLEQLIGMKTIPFRFQYIHDKDNKGLAVAYNYALSIAIKNSYNWFLLLDQDSSLPEDFIDVLFNNFATIDEDSNVAAVVAKMRYKKEIFSPTKIYYGGIVRPIDIQQRGICAFKNVFAIGSGCVIKSSFLQKIGGFNENFPIDCLDRWLFLTINKMEGTVFVTDSIIDHEVSVMNFDKLMNEQRYYSILKYENFFMKSYKSKVENYIFYLRLIKRAIFLFFTARDKKYSFITIRFLMNILVSPEDRSKI
jgi:GT2 family glycosyltransferase